MKINYNGQIKTISDDQIVDPRTYSEKVEALIREEYSINDELAILRQRDSNKAAYLKYFKYVEACLAKAKNEPAPDIKDDDILPHHETVIHNSSDESTINLENGEAIGAVKLKLPTIYNRICSAEWLKKTADRMEAIFDKLTSNELIVFRNFGLIRSSFAANQAIKYVDAAGLIFVLNGLTGYKVKDINLAPLRYDDTHIHVTELAAAYFLKAEEHLELPIGGEAENNARGPYSFAGGYGTQTDLLGQAVVGKYNWIGYDDKASDAIFIVGNGTSKQDRHDAFKVNIDGTISIGNTRLSEQQLKKLLLLIGE